MIRKPNPETQDPNFPVGKIVLSNNGNSLEVLITKSVRKDGSFGEFEGTVHYPGKSIYQVGAFSPYWAKCTFHNYIPK